MTEEANSVASELEKNNALLRWSKAKEKLAGFKLFTFDHFKDIRAAMPADIQPVLTDGILLELFDAFNRVPLPSSKELAAEEMELRKKVAALFFPKPKEGVNNEPLHAGWTLKYTYKIDRSIDEAALPAVKEKLRAMEVNPDPLVRYKPEIATTEYKSLCELNAQAARIFEEALTTKPGSPTLELVAPKEKKA